MLKAAPDWVGGAQAFVSALEVQPSSDGRIEVIDACRAEMGDALYPGFIKLLAAVSRFGDDGARRLAANAFADALSTSKLPSVRVPAFGGGGFPGVGGGLLTHMRSVGPIEFLCLWACRDMHAEVLDADAFETALAHLVRLFDASSRAAVLYQTKLASDAENPLEGLHTQESRQLVRALVAAWEAGRSPEEVARTARQTLRSDPFARLPR